MLRRISAVLLLALVSSVPAFAQKAESVAGYAEWSKSGVLIVDGQRVAVDSQTRIGGDAARDLSLVPLGSEVKIQGVRQADGSILARSIEAKRNRVGLLERSLRDEADAAERQWLRAREIEDPDDPEAGGAVYQSGHHVARARRIFERVLPPYLNREDFRVYVVDNDDWNAFAMANGSIWVYTGLLREMDDDELAVIVGHELAHVTHEHSRRDSKKGIWAGAIAAAIGLAAEAIDNEKARVAVQAATFVSALAAQSAFGRQSEDQADRVGLRYAYEGGFNVSKAPRVWQRFEEKYGSGNRVVNFFLSDHSRAPVRRDHLERQIAWNYRPGVDTPTLAYASTPARPAESELLPERLDRGHVRRLPRRK